MNYLINIFICVTSSIKHIYFYKIIQNSAFNCDHKLPDTNKDVVQTFHTIDQHINVHTQRKCVQYMFFLCSNPSLPSVDCYCGYMQVPRVDPT